MFQLSKWVLATHRDTHKDCSILWVLVAVRHLIRVQERNSSVGFHNCTKVCEKVAFIAYICEPAKVSSMLIRRQRQLEASTVRHRSGATGTVVLVARVIAFPLVVRRSELVVDRCCRSGRAIDLGSFVGNERRDFECSVEVSTDLDLCWRSHDIDRNSGSRI